MFHYFGNKSTNIRISSFHETWVLYSLCQHFCPVCGSTIVWNLLVPGWPISPTPSTSVEVQTCQIQMKIIFNQVGGHLWLTTEWVWLHLPKLNTWNYEWEEVEPTWPCLSESRLCQNLPRTPSSASAACSICRWTSRTSSWVSVRSMWR